MFPVLALVLAAPGSASTDKPSAPAAPYDPCQKQCFTDHKCCPSVLTALDPDECVDRASCLLPSRNDPGDWKARADMLEGTAPRAPESYADFYNMCDEMAGMFSSMEPACCVPEPVRTGRGLYLGLYSLVGSWARGLIVWIGVLPSHPARVLRQN